MRFSCGESVMVERARLEAWHPFFALRPRVIDEKDGRLVCAWLEWIERRGEWEEYRNETGTLLYAGWEWEYRATEPSTR